MEQFFRIWKSKLSAIIKTFGSVIYQITNPLFTDPSIFKHRIPLYAEKIAEKPVLLLILYGASLIALYKKQHVQVNFSD